jgi:hypothetical protein
LKRPASWNTTEMAERSEVSVVSRTSRPSTFQEPTLP